MRSDQRGQLITGKEMSIAMSTATMRSLMKALVQGKKIRELGGGVNIGHIEDSISCVRNFISKQIQDAKYLKFLQVASMEYLYCEKEEKSTGKGSREINAQLRSLCHKMNDTLFFSFSGRICPIQKEDVDRYVRISIRKREAHAAVVNLTWLLQDKMREDYGIDVRNMPHRDLLSLTMIAYTMYKIKEIGHGLDHREALENKQHHRKIRQKRADKQGGKKLCGPV